MTSKPDPPEDRSDLAGDAAYTKLCEQYAESALARIAGKIPAADVPAARAAFMAFFATNPRATQLLEQLVVTQPVDRSGTTVRRDAATLRAAASGGKRR